MSYDKDRAERLTKRILEHSNAPEIGVVANDLLGEYHRGYPLENLRPLLSHENASVVRAGAFIASELGLKGRPLLGDISHLLRHTDPRVRSDVIDCVLLWAGRSNATELASAVGLLGDPHPGVRWKAMEFLSRASLEQLEAALSSLEASEPNSVNVRGLRWLIGSHASDPQDVRTVLQSQDEALRKYGVVAARRMSKSSKEPLLYAASLNDPDVKHFAESSMA
jgi:hypothetical protein